MKLFYRTLGSGEPVLLLHGLFGFSDNWLSIAHALKNRHRIYLLDARNHGRSPHTGLFDYPAMVEDVYEFLGDLSLRQVSLVGHSMGGMTAMNFVLEYPHRVNRLAVIDIAPKSYPLRHRDIVDALLSLDLDRLDSRQEADRLLSLAIPQERTRQFLLKNLYRLPQGKFAWRLNLPIIAGNLANIGQGIDSDRKFTKPCLFIRGELSDYITAEDQSRIKKMFPLADIQTVKNTTHWLHAENPGALISILDGFLNPNAINS